ncbi:hypothetical protein [Tumebacillus flagellatus]|uniref:Uncharacterized protein n=1 Tax=Tumebacillus flagellatus TaxID=1157490 RepID=A0A074MBM2_9BACL|nr:hypothetical protein [Tumebacillus flagellatus]KEO83322.1 hypothetical protein EL26_10115 [Tumebacillus flagellatus]
MQYFFESELPLPIEDTEEYRKAYEAEDARWVEALIRYKAHFDSLADRMTKNSLAFYAKHGLHDHRLASLRMTDGGGLISKPIQVVLQVVTRVDRYELIYRGVTKFQVDY